MTELIPCPFYGSKNLEVRGEILTVFDRCINCGVQGPREFSSKVAAEAWNRRTSPWISCDDRLPDQNSDAVLIWLIPTTEGSDPSCEIAFYFHETNQWEIYDDSFCLGDDEYKVTHWMPLPEPPEGRKE